MKLGSTLHGVGAARARRILRRSDVLLARDIPELKPFICWTDREMMDRLDKGQAGFMEIAQGFQLGYLSQYYPKCTSRNCSVAAGLDDCGLPPSVVQDVIVNFRTYPIRVSSNKYIHAETSKVLTAEDMDAMRANSQEHLIRVLKGDSGGCYPDQQEITWDAVTEASGIKRIDPTREIRERSSLTKLERRVYTFSKQNLKEAVRYNRGGGHVYVSINFINYVDMGLECTRGPINKQVRILDRLATTSQLTPKVVDWINTNVEFDNPTTETLAFLGTGPDTDDILEL